VSTVIEHFAGIVGGTMLIGLIVWAAASAPGQFFR